jgi:hypothetical protein
MDQTIYYYILVVRCLRAQTQKLCAQNTRQEVISIVCQERSTRKGPPEI